jgi:hypothetical protein
VEYLAYRFVVPLKKKDMALFSNLCQPYFDTTESHCHLTNFGNQNSAVIGHITRRFKWMGREEAESKGAVGLTPPEEHLHIVRELGRLSALLIGIEGSAPHKENLFGGKHTAAAASADLTPWGGRKWRDYRSAGQEVPADLGGMRVDIDEAGFRNWTSLCEKANLCRPSQGHRESCREEKKLFRGLLSGADDEIARVLRDRLHFGISNVMHQTGTRVLDDNIRERPTTPACSTSAQSFVSAPESMAAGGDDSDSDLEAVGDADADGKDSPEGEGAGTTRPVENGKDNHIAL